MSLMLDRYYTRAEVLALPDDGNRHELVHGELLVSPAPSIRHQVVSIRLLVDLVSYIRRVGRGRVLASPADISWGLADVTVQPDIFVVGSEDDGVMRWELLRSLPLVVEILSPSTARYDRFTKRRLYQERRVDTYWIVDIENRRVETWPPDATAPQYDAVELLWRAEGATDALRIVLAELFAD